MGHKQSHPLADNEIDMMNRTDLSFHFSNTIRRSYQPDECIHCGAILEGNSLFNSSGRKSSVDISAVRCRVCRVCESTNVILMKFREFTTPFPRFFHIQSATNAESQPFSLDDNHNKMRNQDIVTEHSHNGGASASV